jgi:uncharacterized protein
MRSSPVIQPRRAAVNLRLALAAILLPPLLSACKKSHSAEFERAVCWRSPESVAAYLDSGYSLGYRTRGGETLLEMATFSHNAPVVQLLLERGAPVDAPGGGGRTPLMDACSMGYSEVAKVLISHGARLDAMDDSGQTALTRAAFSRKFDCAALLLDHGAAIDAKDPFGNTSLIWACNNQDPLPMVRFLIGRGADPRVNFRRYDAAVHMCINHVSDADTYQVQETLIAAGWTECDPRMPYAGPALHRAAYWGQLDAVNRLIAQGADVNEPGPLGRTALMAANEGNKLEVMQALISAGADPNAKDADGNTVLIRAARNYHYHNMQFLIARGADPSIPDPSGKLPLEICGPPATNPSPRSGS